MFVYGHVYINLLLLWLKLAPLLMLNFVLTLPSIFLLPKIKLRSFIFKTGYFEMHLMKNSLSDKLIKKQEIR